MTTRLIVETPGAAVPSSTAPQDPKVRRMRVLIVVLALAVAWASLPFLPGLLGAGVLAVLGSPAHRVFSRKIGSRTSALCLTLLALVLIAAPVLLLLATAIQQAPSALERVRGSAEYARLAALHVGPVDVGAELANAAGAALTWASTRAISAAGNVTNGILNLLLALVGVYYLLPAGPGLWRRARRLLSGAPDDTDLLATRFSEITRAALLSIVATALSQGLTVGLAFAMVGLSNPLFWGVITGMVSILPILGSALVWLPGVVVLFLDGRTGAAFTLGIIGVVICSNVDNVIRPFIFRRVSGMHPMVSLLGAFAGVKAMGLIGVLVGPLVLTLFLELLALHETELAGNAAGARSSFRAGL